MEKLQLYRNSSVEWKPSAVVALAASPDGAQVAAAREDGSLEIWLVSPGSVGWHCQLTIQGDPSSRVSSIVWCRPSSKHAGLGRLLSSSIDGTISEWDLFSLQQKVVLDSVGVSIWQLATEPSDDSVTPQMTNSGLIANGYMDDDDDSSDSDISQCDNNSDEPHASRFETNKQRLAVACDDGCLRLYTIGDKDQLNHSRSFPRVSGRLLSVTWSYNGKLIFSGSSDGLIRCWDITSFHEVYRITAGLGGAGSSSELCIWSLLFLRCGTLVSGDSTGSVQFWDSHCGSLLQAQTHHRGDVNALAVDPGHNRVFSAGSDGQVILYKLFNDSHDLKQEDRTKEQKAKWVYIGHVRAHSHDVKALAIAVPISKEDALPAQKVSKVRRREKPISFSYHIWAQMGVPMLISGGDDSKLFAYSAREFTQYSPHDICPAPQRPLVKFADTTSPDGASIMLVQSSSWLDVSLVKLDGDMSTTMLCRKKAVMQLLARVKSKGSRRIICSAVSTSGMLFAYSDNLKPSLFELRKQKVGKSMWSINKLMLPKRLPCAHSMIFSADSSCFLMTGHDRKIYVIDVKKLEVTHTFVPQRKLDDVKLPPKEPPITRMFTSSDGQWLAAISCFGDIYVFNLELYRQHWFVSRLNDSSVTSGGFPPKNSSVFIITTSSNEVYVFDVEAKQLGEWSRQHSNHLPQRFQEFPGEVIGLSFPPSLSSTSVVIYSARAMCLVDFGMPIDDENNYLGADILEKHDSKKLAKIKRKRKHLNLDSRPNKEQNFDFFIFRDPTLFVGHLSDNSLFLLDKQWVDVVNNFDAPIHRHIFGT